MARYMYDHVHLISPNPVQAAEFYENAFGATRVAVGQYPEGGTRVELHLEGTRLLIRTPVDTSGNAEDAPGTRYGLEHFGIRTDDIESAVADLKAKGVKFIQDIKLSPATGSRIAFVMAPDNVMIELVQPARPS
jgi:catechol 2,3-dioxygenase-like lactoylglutathione lyase family enzyme